MWPGIGINFIHLDKINLNLHIHICNDYKICSTITPATAKIFFIILNYKITCIKCFMENALELFNEMVFATIRKYKLNSEHYELYFLPTYRRLSSSAGRSNFMSLSYFFWLASCTKWTFITWSRNLNGGQTGTSQIYFRKDEGSMEHSDLGCAYLSMVPNSHSDSLLNGMSMLWKWAKLVAISTEMMGSESCSVRRRVLWGNSQDFNCCYICFLRERGLHTTQENVASYLT